MDENDTTTRLARLEQRVDDVDRRLADFATINTQMATVIANQGHMDRDFSLLRDEVEGIGKTLVDRDVAVSRERRQTRIALYTMIGVLGASFISGIAAVVVGLVGG